MSQNANLLRKAVASPVAPARTASAPRGFGDPAHTHQGGAGHSLSRISVEAPGAEQSVRTEATAPESVLESPESLAAATPQVMRATNTFAPPADSSGPPSGPPADGGDDTSGTDGPTLPPGAQAKLTVNTPGDQYEQEADAVANRVMRVTDSASALAAPTDGASGIQRVSSQAELIQKREAGSGGSVSGDVSGSVGRGLSGGGQPLDPATRAFMEPRFGQDFSAVRVHTDGAAALSARDVSARAYTLGSDVAFASGQYDPTGDAGRRLLAHELTHVVQQGAAPSGQVRRDPDPAAPTVPSGGAAGPALPDFSTMTWEQLLPHAKGKKGAQIAKVTNAVGVAPTLTYTDAKNITQTPSAAAQSAGVGDAAQAALRQKAFDAAVDSAVAKVVAARAAVPHRTLDRDPFSHKGNFYDPTLGGWQKKDDPKKKTADWNKERADAKKTDTQGADYKKWVDAATPTGLDITKPDDLKKWQIFQATVPLEGHVGEFTTFDNTLSVGTGFSTSGGQAQKVIGKAFNLLPEVKSVAEAAGFLADGAGGMMIVDASQKWILDGQDAAAYIQTDEALISLLINTSQGTQPVAAPPPSATPPASGGGRPRRRPIQRRLLRQPRNKASNGRRFSTPNTRRSLPTPSPGFRRPSWHGPSRAPCWPSTPNMALRPTSRGASGRSIQVPI